MNVDDYSLLEFLGIKYWLSKDILFPFIIQEIAGNSAFISILPLSKKVLNTRINYKNIQSLYTKMLAVLGLDPLKSSKLIFSYQENRLFSSVDCTDFSLKILQLCPKVLLTFGGIEFLDYQVFKCNKILYFNTLHPEELLAKPEKKRAAFKDLLACKEACKYAI